MSDFRHPAAYMWNVAGRRAWKACEDYHRTSECSGRYMFASESESSSALVPWACYNGSISLVIVEDGVVGLGFVTSASEHHGSLKISIKFLSISADLRTRMTKLTALNQC